MKTYISGIRLSVLVTLLSGCAIGAPNKPSQTENASSANNVDSSVNSSSKTDMNDDSFVSSSISTSECNSESISSEQSTSGPETSSNISSDTEHDHVYDSTGMCTVDGCEKSICKEEKYLGPNKYDELKVEVHDGKAYFSFKTICKSTIYINTQKYDKCLPGHDYPNKVIKSIELFAGNNLEDNIAADLDVKEDCVWYWYYTTEETLEPETTYYCTLTVSDDFKDNSIEICTKNIADHYFSPYWSKKEDGTRYKKCTGCALEKTESEFSL